MFILIVCIFIIVHYIIAFNQEKKYEIQIRTVQDSIDEFYDSDGRKKHITLNFSKDKTILDVKHELINHIKYLCKPNFNLRLAVFGDCLNDQCYLTQLPSENNIVKLFIHIPGY